MHGLGRKFAGLAVSLALLAGSFSGCSGTAGGKTFRYDLSGPVQSLDPQFATDADARMIVANLYEGLMVQEPDGSIRPGAAENYERSPDGLRYTFALREGACWSDGGALTARDFVFAFQRMFGRDALSPYAADFACIRGAQAVLDGERGAEFLGVSAQDERTVVFELDHENALFLELLASTAASPCNERVFQESRGRYGLELQFVYSNGPFTLTGWDNTKSLTLSRNDSYVSEQPVAAGGVVLYIGRSDPVRQFLDGKADLVVVGESQLGEVQRQNARIEAYDKTVWCIVFNQNHPVWGNALLRQGLAMSIDPGFLADELPGHLSLTNLFVPPAMHLSGRNYREAAGAVPALSFDPQRAGYLFGLGLAAQELDRLPTTVLLVPDTDSHPLYMGLVQQSWQKYLSAYVNLEAAAFSQLETRLRDEDYQLMLLPFSPATPQPSSLLGVFGSTSERNNFGYYNERYDLVLQQAADEGDASGAIARYAAAEEMLLLDAVVVPVYYETTYYAVRESVEGLQISPFAGQIRFQYAEKN